MSGTMRLAVRCGLFITLGFMSLDAVMAGDSLIVPVSATASSTYGTPPYLYGPQWMVDGSGLTGSGRMATHTNANSTNLFWHSNGTAVPGQWVEFDLGATYDVTNALIWQLAQSGLTSRGVQTFTISVAGDDHVFSAVATTNLNIATGSPNEPVQVRPLVAGEVRFVRFTIQSNYGNQYVGLSEVRFEGALTVFAPLIVPVSATASSNYGSQPYLYGPQWLIDGSGLSGTSRRATHTNANSTNLFWHSNTGIVVSNQWVEFDLGATYQVTNALVWQLAQQNNTSRGVQAFTISVADPDRIFSVCSTNNLLNLATGLAAEPVQMVPLVATNVQYVRFNIESSWGASDIVGLSEVRFDGVPWVQTPRELVWNGAVGDANWNKAAQNWLTNGGATAFASGDHVRFDDTAAEKSVALTNNVAAGAIAVDTAVGYRISAGQTANQRILSAASFIKRGAGTLELDGGTLETAGSYHAFTGGVEIAEGTLKTLSNGRPLKNATEGLLGNMQAARTLRVNTNATLNLAGRYLSGRLDSVPVTELVADHGTLSFSSTNISETAFGPLTLDSARVECVNTNTFTYVAFNGLTRFLGTSTYHFAQTGFAKELFFLDPAGTEACVSNITHDAAWDLRLDWVIRDFHTNGILVQKSGIRKTGAGTLYLGNANNTLSGDITVSEGTLETAPGNGNAGTAVNVLGNPKVSRKVRVANGATLKFNGSNTIATGFDSPLEELELTGGTLSLANNSSSVFGPLTLENATVAYNVGYSATDWGLMIFSKSVTFKGTQPVVFSPAGANCNFQSGLSEETDVNVENITGSSAVDVALNLPFINFGGVTNKPPSRFKKTGPGTLSLGAINASTGALRVVEGVLRVDGRWSQANSSVTAEAGGFLGGTGLVARAIFNGGGFECAMGQAGQLTTAAAVVGATGTVRILNPGGAPITQLNVPFLAYTTLEGAENLANWTVEAVGYPANTSLRVRAKGGMLVAGWSPRGLLIRIQ